MSYSKLQTVGGVQVSFKGLNMDQAKYICWLRESGAGYYVSGVGISFDQCLREMETCSQAEIMRKLHMQGKVKMEDRCENWYMMAINGYLITELVRAQYDPANIALMCHINTILFNNQGKYLIYADYQGSGKYNVDSSLVFAILDEFHGGYLAFLDAGVQWEYAILLLVDKARLRLKH